MNNFSDALAASRKALELKPATREAILSNALCEIYAGSIERAVAVLEKQTSKDPNYPPANILLGIVYLLAGQKEKGIRTFNVLHISGSDFAKTTHPFAQKLISAGRIEYARMLIDIAIENKALSDDYAELLAECERRSSPAISSETP
jgi:tetratricopeptide (TPR) repeat protein